MTTRVEFETNVFGVLNGEIAKLIYKTINPERYCSIPRLISVGVSKNRLFLLTSNDDHRSAYFHSCIRSHPGYLGEEEFDKESNCYYTYFSIPDNKSRVKIINACENGDDYYSVATEVFKVCGNGYEKRLPPIINVTGSFDKFYEKLVASLKKIRPWLAVNDMTEDIFDDSLSILHFMLIRFDYPEYHQELFNSLMSLPNETVSGGKNKLLVVIKRLFDEFYNRNITHLISVERKDIRFWKYKPEMRCCLRTYKILCVPIITTRNGNVRSHIYKFTNPPYGATIDILRKQEERQKKIDNILLLARWLYTVHMNHATLC